MRAMTVTTKPSSDLLRCRIAVLVFFCNPCNNPSVNRVMKLH